MAIVFLDQCSFVRWMVCKDGLRTKDKLQRCMGIIGDDIYLCHVWGTLLQKIKITCFFLMLSRD